MAEETFLLWFIDEVLSHDRQVVTQEENYPLLPGLPSKSCFLQRTCEGRLEEHSIGQPATFGEPRFGKPNWEDGIYFQLVLWRKVHSLS